ncbi:SDR family oxidoreductase [Actinoallomurus liliacearum]|uniref:SDR family oxidoreductase n=1 Tax=Actinoallomurus liliacearum TaxID=1080073 RepID=A0ABP8U062_9ACTN
MRIDGCVALVTGANRGLGAVFARTLLEHGARRVYAGARNPDLVSDSGMVPIRLDVTEPEQVADAVQRCADVTLLINNAGVLTDSPLVDVPTMKAARTEMEVNYFGTLSMCRAFAPVLARNGGGAMVNVLSVASFFANPAMGSYAASKAAAWALTNGVRVELRRQGTQVVAVHSGYIDTDMAAHVAGPKTSPETVVTATLDALEAGAEEVLADERTRQIKAAVPTDLDTIYPGIQLAGDRRTPSSLQP